MSLISALKIKKKEFSPQDAVIMVHMSFRAYLIRRSQALRALRDLAVAKAKLKEIRVLFNNCRHRVTGDAEERQRIFEKIMVLLIHVDDIEGADPWCKNYNLHPKETRLQATNEVDWSCGRQ